MSADGNIKKLDRGIRIGGAGGFWGDSVDGPFQLIRSGEVDYVIMDYLAEITMSIMARGMSKNPNLGYATDFVTQVIKRFGTEIAASNIKIVCNAGGCNPRSCKAEIEAELERLGLNLKVAAVVGDDVTAHLPALRSADLGREMWTQEPLPEDIATANAYLGGFPVASALDAGADIVVTGRCADSALVLGILIHEFGWQPDDLDQLAGGSLAGHMIECGAQATGGYYTDWKDAVQGWPEMGFPIVVCRSDGSFDVTKPSGTGGVVNYGVVAEQVTYETGDPRAYVLPDVVCDLGDVAVREIGQDLVRVSGIKGRSPTPYFKVSATVNDGYRCLTTLFVKGIDAKEKAQAMGDAILARARRWLNIDGYDDFSETSIELLGAEATYGHLAVDRHWREVVLKIAVRHTHKNALEIFSREIFPAATAMAQGISGIFGGRPKVQPVVRLHSFLVEKTSVRQMVLIGENELTDIATYSGPFSNLPNIPISADDADISGASQDSAGMKTVRLIDIAYARSGDKGDTSNIAVIARSPQYFDVLRQQLTAKRVADFMRHVAKGRVQRFTWPGLDGFNFLLENALGGGGIASLHYDPQGKGYAQMLLEFPIEVPAQWEVEVR